jgi:hypothetical protein
LNRWENNKHCTKEEEKDNIMGGNWYIQKIKNRHVWLNGYYGNFLQDLQNKTELVHP